MKPSTHPSIGSMLRAGGPLFCVLLAGAFLGPDAFALDPLRSLPQYNCRTWTRQNGLPANGINAIVQGTKGYLWLGTSAGLARFDGIDFDLLDLHQVPNLRSANVSSLSRSAQGGLWLGLGSGAFAYYDGQAVSSWGKAEWGGEYLKVQSVLEASNGDLWIAAQSGAFRLTPERKFETILPAVGSTEKYDVSIAYEDSTGRIWLGTTQNGLFYWRGGTLTKFADPALDSTPIRAVVEDKQGRIWIGAQAGLFCYDADLRHPPMTLATSETNVLFLDREGAVWAGTNGTGVVRYWHDVGTPMGKAEGLTDDFVKAIAQDHEGNVWIGTRNGLSQLSDVKMPTFSKADGLVAEVCVAVSASPRGGVWVATDAGIMRFDGQNRLEAYGAESGMVNAYTIAVLEARNGDVYAINGQRDVVVFSGGKLVARYPNKNWPTALAEDKQGMVVAVDGTLYRVSPDTYAPYLLADGGQPALSYVLSLAAGADGSIWAAVSDEGIFRVKDGTVTRWSGPAGSRAEKANWICEDDEGVIWAGLSGGIARVKNEKIQRFTKDDGLFDNVISAIVPDLHGNFWVYSDRAFFRISRRSLDDFADGKTKRLECTPYDGLEAVKSAERNQQKPSGCRTSDGRIWFPTAQGVVMIDPIRLGTHLPPPTVRIQTARANLQELARDAEAIVPPGAGDLEFHYAGLSYIAPLKIQYQYMLAGYDTNWVDAGDRRLAAYTNLPPGAYTFRVKAANADGIWSETAESLKIELLPHLYQTGWFYALCAGAVLALLAALYLWRVRVLRHRQRALVQARDRLEAEVQSRTADLARANSSLHHEVDEHKHTAEKLAQRTGSLEGEIEERKAAERRLEQVHGELLEISRQAGMAEVATSVLHNVGNVLNSVNVSTTLVAEQISRSESAQLARVCALLRRHESELGGFFSADPKGRQVLGFLETLTEHLAAEQATVGRELGTLRKNIDHIKEIVAMQQTYARVTGVVETVLITELVEHALRMNEGALVPGGVEVVSDFQARPTVTVEKHKVLQILVNLIRNAKHACDDSGRPDKVLTLRVTSDPERVRIAVIDNGVGIPAENLTRIFSHGFTTRKEGHGFGLHSGALAARELGGSLTAGSEGPGCGAVFVLELPHQPAVVVV